MTPSNRRPGHLGYRPFVPALVIGLVIGLVLVVALPPSSPTGTGSGRWVAAGVWSNGVLSANMTPDRPAATVSSASTGTSYGLYAGVSVVSELSSAGVEVASANLDAASWTVTNTSGPGGLALSYVSQVPVTIVASGSPSGSAQVLVNFSSVASSGSAGAPQDQVAFGLAVLGWPWVQAGDRLAITMPLWPQDTSVAFLASQPGVANSILCLSQWNSSPLESFAWESSATARTGGQAPEPLQGLTHVVGNGTFTSVEVVFVGASSGYSELSYDPQIRVPLPGGASGLPILDYGVAGGALVIGLMLGVIGLRHTWNQRPALERET